MKAMHLYLVASFTLLFFCPAHFAQEKEPLRPDWLAEDYNSIKLISSLASPAPLSTQRIRER